MAVNNKPEYDGLVLWDINTVKEADDDRKQRLPKKFTTSNMKTFNSIPRWS